MDITHGNVETHRDTSTEDDMPRVFTAASCTIPQLWKQHSCPSVGEWMKKLWYTYPLNYYLAVKKNEILPLATVWMDLESGMSVRKTNTF